MGTSTSNRGQIGKTPLVPSWLDDENSNDNINPQEIDPKRFSLPRNNLTRYANSGGNSSNNLHSAAARYAKQSLGGSRNATLRLGAARKSTAKLITVLNGFVNRGVNETSRSFNLGNLTEKKYNGNFVADNKFYMSRWRKY